MTASNDDPIDRERFARRLARERAARKQAESLLEQKSRELFASNEELRRSRDELEARVAERTRELAAANAELRRAGDLALRASRAKSEFLANMSHEIRTPLHGILGSLQILMAGEAKNVSEFATTAYESARLLLRLLDDILDLSKIEAGRMELCAEPTDLPALLEQTASLFRDRAREKGLSLAKTVGDGVPACVRVDPTRLRQVLCNLLGNAVKFTEQGGVALRVGARPSEGGFVHLDFAVEDTGIGIAAERLDAIFEKFTQAEATVTRRFGGSGLGLTLSRELVRLLGGDIRVESTVGTGSRFSFSLRLPLASAARTTNSDWSPDARLAGIRVLLVEDGEINRRIARHALKRYGCIVHEAVDGRQAVEAAKEHDFDVVLMDCQMPVMSGYEATHLIRDPATGARDPNVPILALTANAMSGDREICLDAGMDGYVKKPFELRQIWDAILEVLERKGSGFPLRGRRE